MDELTKYFNSYVKANKKVLESYEKGLLTLQEAANTIIKDIQESQQTEAARAVLESFNFKGFYKSIDETAAAFVKFYGEEAPQKIIELYEKK